MKEILKDARQTKLRRRVKDDLSDPMTTSTKVSTRYKEDVEYLKDHFNEYEIEVKETACGWSVQVTHQMKTPLEKKCEELQERLTLHRLIEDIRVNLHEKAPNIILEYTKRNVTIPDLSFLVIEKMPFHATISRAYFDAHTVEELAAAIEGLYFA